MAETTGESWKTYVYHALKRTGAWASLLAICSRGCALGARARGAYRARLEASPQWKDGRFRNTEALYNNLGAALLGYLQRSPNKKPKIRIPTFQPDPYAFDSIPESGLRATWFGHSSVLLEIEGLRVLTDPVWGERASPLNWAGPKRWYEPPLRLQDLPPVDVVVISHDHYDHLDYPSILQMARWSAPFIVPLGVGAHLRSWGIPPERIIELDWWERKRVGSVDIVCTPARHASGRSLTDHGKTLWAGFAFLGARRRVYFSGDTGLFPGMKTIGDRLGPFDMTMIECGAYHRAWPDWHIGPEQAIRAHRLLRGKEFLPIHWGLFDLAYHAWNEPVERVLIAAEKEGVPVILPKVGQSFEPTISPPRERWWPELPFETAEQSPIVSTKLGVLGP